MTVLNGMFGGIDVEEKHYDFKMPDFSQLDDAALAAALNFVVFDLAGAADIKPLSRRGHRGRARPRPRRRGGARASQQLVARLRPAMPKPHATRWCSWCAAATGGRCWERRLRASPAQDYMLYCMGCHGAAGARRARQSAAVGRLPGALHAHAAGRDYSCGCRARPTPCSRTRNWPRYSIGSPSSSARPGWRTRRRGLYPSGSYACTPPAAGERPGGAARSGSPACRRRRCATGGLLTSGGANSREL